jgi:hypothetical protein
MEAIIPWITSHGSDLLAIWGGLVAVATVVCKITPTTKDDEILAKVVKLADWFSVVNPRKA